MKKAETTMVWFGGKYPTLAAHFSKVTSFDCWERQQTSQQLQVGFTRKAAISADQLYIRPR
jgi:hypothetical protein